MPTKKAVKKEVKKKTSKKNEFEEQDEQDQASEETAELAGQEPVLDDDGVEIDPEIVAEESASQDAVDAPESNDPVLTCPKCGMKYQIKSGEKNHPGIFHVKASGNEIYCEPCAASWLQRSGARML